MSALADTRVTLIRPTVTRPMDPTSSDVRKIVKWQHATRELSRLRRLANGASTVELEHALNEHDDEAETFRSNGDEALTVTDYANLARVARRVTREADKLRAQLALRAYEDRLVAEGHARLL